MQGRGQWHLRCSIQTQTHEPTKSPAWCAGPGGLPNLAMQVLLNVITPGDGKDKLVACKSGLVSATEAAVQLERDMSHFFTLHRAAYGKALIKPKHNWLLDVPSQLRRDGMMLNAFVIERKRLMVKRFRNTYGTHESSKCRCAPAS